MAAQRSKPYPRFSVKEAVDRIESLVKKVGSGHKHDRLTFAQGLGYKDDTNGAFLRAVAALIQFGLVHREGDSYVLSSLSQQILYPTDDSQRQNAIKEAALGPSMFKQIYSDYSGDELPALLPNILVAKYGVLPGAKDKVVSIFRTSMEAAGLLRDNRLLLEDDQLPSEDATDEKDTQKAQEGSSEPKAKDMPKSTPGIALTTLTKDFGHGRVASLSIPSDISDEERAKLMTLIENM